MCACINPHDQDTSGGGTCAWTRELGSQLWVKATTALKMQVNYGGPHCMNIYPEHKPQKGLNVSCDNGLQDSMY